MCIYLLIYSFNLHYTQNLGLFYDSVHSSVLFAFCHSFILILFLFWAPLICVYRMYPYLISYSYVLSVILSEVSVYLLSISSIQMLE